jgi:hypothetical protein
MVGLSLVAAKITKPDENSEVVPAAFVAVAAK